MELLDVYNEFGKPTGKVIQRGCKDAFAPGERIAVAIIYIENSKHEFLIQKTSEKKGGNYSSTGGHVDHGETPLETIIREVKEELGIDISNEKIEDLGFQIIDFPVRFIFYLKKDIDINDFVLQKDEVESVSYMNEEQIRDLIDKKQMHEAHGKILELILENRK